jgi:hypothetical protein
VLKSINLSGYFYYFGFQKFLPFLQVLSSSILLVLGFLKIKNMKDLLIFMSFGYLIFLLLNVVTWNYLYIPLIIFLIFRVIVDYKDQKELDLI